jgi:ribosomal protein S18 acetylase RimI-like enzyme
MSSRDADYLSSLFEATMRGYVEEVWGPLNEVDSHKFLEDALSREAFDTVLENGVRVGAVSIQEHDTHLQLEHLYIEEAHQNQGLGARVVRGLLARAAQSSKPVRLRVLRPNPAKRLYERLGFVVTQTTAERYFMEHHGPLNQSSR